MKLVKKYNAIIRLDTSALMLVKEEILFGKMQTREMKILSGENMKIPTQTAVASTERLENLNENESLSELVEKAMN